MQQLSPDPDNDLPDQPDGNELIAAVFSARQIEGHSVVAIPEGVTPDLALKIARSFVLENASRESWECFKKLAPLAIEQGERIDTFARAFLDLVTIVKNDPQTIKDLGNLTKYTSQTKLGLHHFVRELATRFQDTDLGSVPLSEFATVFLISRLFSQNFKIEFEVYKDIRKDPALKSLLPAINKSVLKPQSPEPKLFSYNYLDILESNFKSPLAETFKEDVTKRLSVGLPVVELLNRLHHNLGVVLSLDTAVQDVLSEAIPYYYQNKFNSSELIPVFLQCSEFLFQKDKLEQFKTLLAQCKQLSIPLPNGTYHYIQTDGGISNSELLTVRSIENLWLEIKPTPTYYNHINYRSTLSKLAFSAIIFKSPESTFESLRDDLKKISSEDIHAINSLLTNVSPRLFDHLIEPLGVCYKSSEFIEKKKQLSESLSRFFTNIPFSLKGNYLKTLNEAIDFYKKNNWDFLQALKSFELFTNHKNIDFAESFSRVVKKCIENDIALNSINEWLVLAESGLNTTKNGSSYQFVQKYLEYSNPLLIKINKLAPADFRGLKKPEKIKASLIYKLQIAMIPIASMGFLIKPEDLLDKNGQSPFTLLNLNDSQIARAVENIFKTRLESICHPYYNGKNWDRNRLKIAIEKMCNTAFEQSQSSSDSDLIKQLIWDSQVLSELFNTIQHYQKNEWPLELMLEKWCNFRRSSFFNHTLVSQIIERPILFESIPLSLFCKDRELRDYQLDAFEELSKFFYQKVNDQVVYNRLNEPVLNSVSTSLGHLVLMEANEFLFTKLIRGLNHNSSSHYIQNLCRDILAHRAMQLLMYGQRWQNLGDKQKFKFEHADSVMKSFKTGHPPYSTPHNGKPSKGAIKAISETREVGAFAFDQAYSFKADRYNCTRVFGVAPIVDFGLDSGAKVYAVNASNINATPGPGYVLKALDPLKGFTPDPGSSKESPTFSQYEQNWSYGKAINDLLQTEYWMMRYMKAIVPPLDSRFSLNGEHFTLLLPNILTENYNCLMAQLVPTKVWRELTEGILIEASEYSGYSAAYRDACSNGQLELSSINSYCIDQKLMMFDVASGSCFYASLVNSGKPGLPPFHSWELQRLNESKDSWGHVHMSHAGGGYNPIMKLNDEILLMMQQGHSSIYNLMQNFQNLMFVFLKYQSLWRRGLTTIDQNDVDNSNFENDSNYEYSDSAHPQIYNPHANRMLCYAYKAYNYWQEHGTKLRNPAPVIFATEALRPSRSPEFPAIDTENLLIHDGQNWVNLPPWGTGNGEEEKELFRNLVLKRLTSKHDLIALDRIFAHAYF